MPNERCSPRGCFFLALAALTCGPVSAAPGEGPVARQAITLQKGSFTAALSAVDDRWRVTFRTGEKAGVVPATELVSWGAPQELSSRPYVLLIDGSLLAADELSTDQQQLRISSELFGSVGLPLEVVSSVFCRPPLDKRRLDSLLLELQPPNARRGSGDKPAEASTQPVQRANADLLILENGDRLTGTIAKIADGKAALETESGPVSIELDRISAIRFNPSLLSPARPRGLHVLVGFPDGSLLTASKLVFDGRQSRLSLSCAVDLTTDADSPLFLQALGGSSAYLSDLASDSYLHIPYLKVAWPYERDRSVSGARLRADGRLYVKGIGMHSASRLTYRLDSSYRRFEAQLAVDDDTTGRGSVVFRVFLDDREAYKSPIIRGRMPPTPISIDVRDAKRLSLIVDFAERGDELDHADWLNARLVK